MSVDGEWNDKKFMEGLRVDGWSNPCTKLSEAEGQIFAETLATYDVLAIYLPICTSNRANIS